MNDINYDAPLFILAVIVFGFVVIAGTIGLNVFITAFWLLVSE